MKCTVDREITRITVNWLNNFDDTRGGFVWITLAGRSLLPRKPIVPTN